MMRFAFLVLILILIFQSCSSTNNSTREPASVATEDGELIVEFKGKGFLALTAIEGCHQKSKIKNFIWRRAHKTCRANGFRKAASFQVEKIEGQGSWLLHFFDASVALDLYAPTSCHRLKRRIAGSKTIKGPSNLPLTLERKFLSVPQQFTYLKCK